VCALAQPCKYRPPLTLVAKFLISSLNVRNKQIRPEYPENPAELEKDISPVEIVTDKIRIPNGC